MKFKDTEYGELTGQIYNRGISVSELGLTSLEGAPKIVNGVFYCSDNLLTSLKFSPKEINGVFYCYHNQSTSLEYLNFYKNIESDFSDSEIDEYYKVNFPQYLI